MKKISDTITLGKTGLQVTPVGIGILPIGPGQLNLPIEEGADILCHALTCGINFIDTAQYYQTYPYIKEGLKKFSAQNSSSPRFSLVTGSPSAECFDTESEGFLSAPSNNPVICSKSLCTDYDGMLDAIEEACRELDRPFIDIFLLHEIRTGQFEERKGAWQALKDAKASGLIKAMGISTHHVDVTESMAEEPDCDVIFPLINYASMGIRKGSQAADRSEMEAAIRKCHDAGKGVFSMKAFGGGNLTGHYQQALDYVFSLESIDSVMLGFGNKSEIDDICSYLSGSMKKGYQPDVTKKKMYVNQEDCEGCGTCLRICHSKAITYNKNGLAQIDQARCLTCGYCAQGCPVRAIIMY